MAGNLPELVWRELKEALPKGGLVPFLERHPERFRMTTGKDGKLRVQVFPEPDPTPDDGGDQGGQGSGSAGLSTPPAPPPAAGGVASWKVADVVLFLNHLELPHLAPIITTEGVDGAMLLALGKAGQLCELGLSKFQAQKIISRLPPEALGLPTADGVAATDDPSSSSR